MKRLNNVIRAKREFTTVDHIFVVKNALSIADIFNLATEFV
ncbi:hypothetical protein PALB_21300 [Pseudoalteromonas luteoviolacea B = ATCC 29581]|nr:hypothetical protein PALB_21300 [Pseudoalteromonas luteoviolacea B = ATCC 29581]